MTSLSRRTFTPPDDVPPILAKRTPALAYDRCLDCGTDEGQPCYDSNDRPLASVCQGRTLSSRGSLDRETRKKYKQKKARAGQSNTGPALPRKEPIAARLNPCNACGIGVEAPRKWCWRSACQAVALKRCRKVSRPPPVIYECTNCGNAYEALGGAITAQIRHCRAPACRIEHKRKVNARRRKYHG